MISLTMLAAIAVVAFIVAWIVNGFVGLLGGERPRDTGRLWFDIFFRFLVILELGIVGRILNCVGFDGLPRKIIFFIGLCCLVVFLVRGCDNDERREPIHTYPVQFKKSVSSQFFK